MNTFNLKKLAKKDGNLNREDALKEVRTEQGTEVPETQGINKNLETLRKDSNEVTIEGVLDKDRGSVGNKSWDKESSVKNETLEMQMDKREAPDKDIPQRSGKDSFDQNPVNLLNQIADAERAKAFGVKDASTDFWDKALGVEPPQSQLHNDPSRFTSLTKEDVLENKKVRKMVFASVKDADAMVYFIYHQAASESRPVNIAEETIIKNINSDKTHLIELLMAE